MSSLKFAELPTPRSPRYQSLDMWRGIACLAVVVFHATYYSPPTSDAVGMESAAAIIMQGCTCLWLGVPMFFVISGYCISATADSSRRKAGGALGEYFLRRFRRIYPPYWALFGISLVPVLACERFIWPGLFTDDNHPLGRPELFSVWRWFGNLTLTETWRHNVAGDSVSIFLGHAWTLCYEEQFYVVCGIILLVAPRRFFASACAVSVLVVPLAVVANKLNLTGVFFDGQWLNFYAGILVYVHINYAHFKLRRVIEASLLLGMAAYWWDPLHKWHGASLMSQGFVSNGFALTLICLHRWDGAIATSRFTKPLSCCGVMCYSLYLVHWPITKAISHLFSLNGWQSNMVTLVVTVPACLAASLLFGGLFHVLVERRFLNTRPAPRQEFSNVAADAQTSQREIRHAA